MSRLVELSALLAAARVVERGSDDLAAVKTLLAAGSASLGGARPKASIRDGDRLSIAKFPHQANGWNVMAWEATALDLAARCDIKTPPHRLERVGDASILLVERFDRSEHGRLPYISAMTLLDRTDGEDADYVEIAEAFAVHGSRVRDYLRQLWRRIAFCLAVNNTDDHLRNHGFLRAAGGWTLAPIFDVNPNPEPTERLTSIVGSTDRVGGLEALLGVARGEALEAWDRIRRVVSGWRTVAGANGISVKDQHRFADGLAATRGLTV